MKRETEDFPERVRINSIPLLKILRNIAGNAFKDVNDRPIVVLRPYNPLLYHLKDLQDTLNNLNNKWGVGLSSLGDVKADDPVCSVGSGFASMDAADSELGALSEETTTSVTELHESAEARDDLQCLVRFLEERLEHINDRLKGQKAKIQFHDLWHIFKPGSLVFVRDTPDMVWKVLQATGGRHYLSASSYDDTTASNVIKGSDFYLDCYYIDYDGQEFSLVQSEFQIEEFKGEQDITSLSIYPVQYVEWCANRLKELTIRGEKFVEASKIQHMYCKGRTVTRTPSGARMEEVTHPEDLDSPVMIDFDRTLQSNPNWRPIIGWHEPYKQSQLETAEMTLKAYVTCNHRGNCNTEYCCMNDNIVNDYSWDHQRMNDFINDREKLNNDKSQTEHQGPSSRVPTDEWKLLPNRVFGFILRNRKWGKYAYPLHFLKTGQYLSVYLGSMRLVPDLEPVEKDSSGLRLLELPPGHETIINSLVQTYFKNRDIEKTNPTTKQFNFDPVRAKDRCFL
jgi:hypothetical protein